jgi:hypothetical protein
MLDIEDFRQGRRDKVRLIRRRWECTALLAVNLTGPTLEDLPDELLQIAFQERVDLFDGETSSARRWSRTSLG